MRVVIDANVLISALIRDGVTRRLIFKSELYLVAPKFILVEVEKYKKEIQIKSKLTDEQVGVLLNGCISEITLVEDVDLVPFLRAAETLTAADNDLLYLACALKVNADIWTNDKGFQNQNRVKIWTTEQLVNAIL